jgi:hypothetical protein
MYFTDYFDVWGLLFGVLLPIALVLWVVSLIIRWVRRLHGGETAQMAHHLTAEEFKQYALGFAIAVVTPLFLYFLEKTVLPGGEFSNDNASFQFGLGVALGLVVFILGLTARRVPVVGTSLATGGLLYLVAIVTLHFPGFDPVMKLLISVLGLVVIIAAGYWITAQDASAGRSTPTLSGMKAFGMGFLAFLFSGMVIINTIGSFVTEDLAYTPEGDRVTFMITLGLSILFLILGLAIKVVRSVGWGMLLTGVITIFYTLFVGFDVLGGTGVVLITGLGLVALVYFAYHQFASHPPGTELTSRTPIPPTKK